MKNAPETMTTMSSVDHRDALAALLDGEIMQLNRRRDVVQAQIDSMIRERDAIDDAVEVANNSITALKDRQVGLTNREQQ